MLIKNDNLSDIQNTNKLYIVCKNSHIKLCTVDVPTEALLH